MPHLRGKLLPTNAMRRLLGFLISIGMFVPPQNTSSVAEIRFANYATPPGSVIAKRSLLPGKEKAVSYDVGRNAR